MGPGRRANVFGDSQSSRRTLEKSKERSVDPLVGTGCVHHLEGLTSALVEDSLGIEALVLVVTIGNHALSEEAEGLRALFLQDVLTGGALIFSGEATQDLGPSLQLT